MTAPGPINVIHSGHDLTWLEKISKKQKRSDSLVHIGYIGQIIPIKGVHILIAGFMSAALAGQAELSIFGDHNKDQVYRTHLESLLNGQEVSVKFLGSFPHKHLGAVFLGIDVLVVPSQWHENNPRVIQEAFASKTPVIASNVGGTSEFVQHEVNGLLFERDDVDDLARQLLRIINESDLLERLRAGIPPVKSIAEEVGELESIYKELMVQAKHSSGQSLV